MSLHQVNKIIEKLSSCSLDVQSSAVRNLLSKIQCGLIDTNEMCDRYQNIANILLKWVINQSVNTHLQLINEIIELITNISNVLSSNIQHTHIKQNLKSEVQVICQFRDRLISQNVNNPQLDLILKQILDGNQIQIIEKQNCSFHVVQDVNIIAKPDVKLQEYQHFPFIKLTEQDEKFLFDISVQLKFGNNQTILFTIKEQIWRALKDFPIEVFRSKVEIVEELLILCNSQKEDNVIYYSLVILQKIIKKISKRLDSQKQYKNFNNNPEVYTKDTREHIIYSYPSLNPQSQPFRPELNQKTLKNIIDTIVKHVLQNYSKFTGRRIDILYQLAKFLDKVIKINQDAALDTLFLLINEITSILDITEQQLTPLYQVGYELFQLIPEGAKISQISRFCSYLEVALYNQTFNQKQMQYLFRRFDGQKLEKASQTLELLFSKQYTTETLSNKICSQQLQALEQHNYILPLQITATRKCFQVQKLEVSMEELSSLETKIMATHTDYNEKIESINSLLTIIIYYTKDIKDFVSQVQVKESMLRQYINDLMKNLAKGCSQQFQKYREETNYKLKQLQEQLIVQFLDLFVVGINSGLENLQSIAIELLNSQSQTTQMCAFRYLAVQIITQEILEKENLYHLSKLLFDYKGSSAQFWESNMTMQNKVTQLLNSFQSLIIEGIHYQRYTQKQFYLKKQEDAIQSLDLLLAMKANNVICLYDNSILDHIKSLMSSTQFLVSGKQFILNMISNFEETKSFWLPLLSYVHQCFLENVGEEQIEYLNLYLQLLSVVKQKSEIGKSIVKYLSKYQFNIKVANFILKLLKNDLIEQQPELLKYLQQNIFQFYNQCNYQNSHCLIKLLQLSKKFNFFSSLDPLDQQLLFSRIIQLTKSHLIIVRYLALNIISLHFKQLTSEQISRIEDQLIDDLYQSNESQYVYSQLITILLKLQPTKKLTRIVSYTENRLKSDISPICKAGLLRLVYICAQQHKEEAIPLIYNLQIDNHCSQYLIKYKEIEELFIVFHSFQILNLLMRQSVSKALSLLQSYNLIELTIHSLHKLKKYLICDQPNVIQGILTQGSLLLQTAAYYHKDYFEFEYNRVRKTKTKWNVIQVISEALQNDNFSVSSKICVATTLQIVYESEFSLSINEDLIHSLISIFRQLDPEECSKEFIAIIQILSALASINNVVKQLLCHTGVANQIITFIKKEVEIIITKQTKAATSNKNKLNQSNVSFNDTCQLTSQFLKTCFVFFKLLFKTSNNGEAFTDNSIANIIGSILQILCKLLLIGFTSSSQVAFEYFIELCSNLGGNQQLNSYVSQKLSEQKWSLITDLKKFLNKEQLTLFQNEIVLKALGILGQNQDVRQVYIRLKIIEDVQEKLIKTWNDKRKWQSNSQFNQHIVTFIVSLSFYKETQLRILSSQQFSNILQEILTENNIQIPICQDIMLIYSNCSLNNKLKKGIVNNKDLDCIVMNVISESTLSPDIRYKASQFLLNLFYKCTQAVNIFNKDQVQEQFEYSMKETQRQIDKLSLNDCQLISKQEENAKQIKFLQQFSNNLNQILKILRIEW